MNSCALVSVGLLCELGQVLVSRPTAARFGPQLDLVV